MISSKRDYLFYLEADRIALNREKSLESLMFDDIWRFQRRLRKLEYLKNTGASIVRILIAKYMLRSISTKLSFTIPINCFGPGLSIAHYGTIVVNGAARIGANCRIHVCTNIGTAAGESGVAPVIGNNCYIGPGVKIFGKIRIGNDIAIAANAVVNKSFTTDDLTLGGIPAKVISQKGSGGLLVEATKVLSK